MKTCFSEWNQSLINTTIFSYRLQKSMASLILTPNSPNSAILTPIGTTNSPDNILSEAPCSCRTQVFRPFDGFILERSLFRHQQSRSGRSPTASLRGAAGGILDRIGDSLQSRLTARWGFERFRGGSGYLQDVVCFLRGGFGETSCCWFDRCRLLLLRSVWRDFGRGGATSGCYGFALLVGCARDVVQGLADLALHSSEGGLDGCFGFF